MREISIANTPSQSLICTHLNHALLGAGGSGSPKVDERIPNQLDREDWKQRASQSAYPQASKVSGTPSFCDGS